MKRSICGLLVTCLVSVAGCLSSPPLHQSLNEPGERVELRRYLSSRKTNVVYFYADWCPGCEKWKPTMEAVNAQFPNVMVHYVNLGDFDSPVARQYGITSVPSFRVLDRKGRLIAEGNAANRWLRQEIARRVGTRRQG
jgi:thiol-disulfide isomerase/thioredoxin